MRTSPTSGSKPAAGFTLVELLVTLVILGLAAAVVVPPLGSALGIGRLRTESAAIVTSLREARAAALVSGRTVMFVTEGSRGWRIGDEVRYLPEPLTLTLDVPPAGYDVDRRPAIRFFPDGRATGGRVIVSSNDASRAVRVDWITGHVHEE